MDSLTHDRVVKRDWRVYQVKTARLTTNTSTTQYWHWVDSDMDTDGDPMFEQGIANSLSADSEKPGDA